MRLRAREYEVARSRRAPWSVSAGEFLVDEQRRASGPQTHDCAVGRLTLRSFATSTSDSVGNCWVLATSGAALRLLTLATNFCSASNATSIVMGVGTPTAAPFAYWAESHEINAMRGLPGPPSARRSTGLPSGKLEPSFGVVPHQGDEIGARLLVAGKEHVGRRRGLGWSQRSHTQATCVVHQPGDRIFLPHASFRTPDQLELLRVVCPCHVRLNVERRTGHHLAATASSTAAGRSGHQD